MAIYSLNIIGAAPFLVKLIEIFADLFFHCLWCHVGYKTDGKLSNNLRKQFAEIQEEEEEEEESVLARLMTEVSPYRVLHYAVANSLLKPLRFNENTYLFRDHSFGTRFMKRSFDA